jgi:hypothetical protein
MRTTRPVQPASVLLWLAVVALLVLIAVVVCRPAFPARDVQPARVNPAVANVPSAQVISNAPTTPLVGSPATNSSSISSNFQLRPFAAVKETAMHQWTDENGRDTNIIRQLAHNEPEYQRMVDENSHIQRRQLVYRNDTAAAVMQRARLSGKPVEQLTIPGFDGQELQVTVERADLEPSKQAGTFTGRLANQPNSMVTLAFKFGREAFTVLSPDDGTYLQAHPREPGELIITSFEPDTYQPVPGGEPIRTSGK